MDITTMTPELVRFRADPAKVRVSVRRLGCEWIAFVMSRNENDVYGGFWHTNANPEVAIENCLQRADDKLDGIDLHMGRAYDHPWKRVPAATYGIRA